ncbi:MAG: response regulator [Thermodesulfobacteriota bacterium]
MLPETNQIAPAPQLLQAALYIACGINLAALANSLLVWYRRTRSVIHLSFALCALTILFLTLMSSLIYQAESLDEITFWLRLKQYSVILFAPSFAWFISLFCRLQRPWLLAAFGGASLIFLIANTIAPHPFLFTDVQGLTQMTLPWGETISLLQARTSILGKIYFLLLLSALLLPLAALSREQDPRRRRETISLLACGLILVATVINDILVYRGVTPFYISEFGFLAVILTMAANLANQLNLTLYQSSAANLRTNKELAHQVTRRTAALSASLTDLRQAQREAERANRAKSLFLATMSHEIRTPMNGIIGIAELAIAEANNEEQRERLLTVYQVAGQLLQTINDILDFSKLDAAKLSLDKAPFKLQEALEEGLAPLRCGTFSPPKLRLTIDPETPDVVLGDGPRLAQVINKLTAHIMAEGTVREVTISVQPAHALPSPLLSFAIVANGARLQPEPLSPSSPYTITEHDNGLGLALAHELVTLMGGQLQLQEGGLSGREFHFVLPFPSETGPETGPPPAAPGKIGPGRRALLVEDEEINRMLAQALLEQMGLTVSCAENGQKALEMFQPGKFDLILMDIQMPVMDGFAATRAIRAEEEAMQRIPIIATTAHAINGYREQVLNAGFDDYLAKPFRGTDLQAIIAKWLS